MTTRDRAVQVPHPTLPCTLTLRAHDVLCSSMHISWTTHCKALLMLIAARRLRDDRSIGIASTPWCSCSARSSDRAAGWTGRQPGLKAVRAPARQDIGHPLRHSALACRSPLTQGRHPAVGIDAFLLRIPHPDYRMYASVRGRTHIRTYAQSLSHTRDDNTNEHQIRSLRASCARRCILE